MLFCRAIQSSDGQVLVMVIWLAESLTVEQLVRVVFGDPNPIGPDGSLHDDPLLHGGVRWFFRAEEFLEVGMSFENVLDFLLLRLFQLPVRDQRDRHVPTSMPR